jgi:DNA-binding response OmpR family regulator
MSKKILVVDDESSIREALSKVLQAEDYEVVTAENGQEAIEKIKSEKIELMLLDLGLPVKDGWDIVIWLAQVNPLLPVIIITGRWNQRELAEKMGADALMDKPLDVPHLLQTIRDLTNDSMERRAQHAKQRPSFRYVPCDRELFLEKLRERATTPYRCPDWRTTDLLTP